jgi:hypothetical protein
MKDQVISLEVAKLAKENQFNIPTQKAYINNEIFVNYEEVSGYCNNYRIDADDFYKNWNKVDWLFDKNGLGCFGCKLDNKKYFETYSAPTQSLLQKWLREKHDIIVNVYPHYESLGVRDGWFVRIEGKDAIWKKFSNYEEALETSLKEALLLINH